jgi:hypothetical protein
MMDPISIVSVVGATAALITAFKDGASLFRKWREKRKVAKLQGADALGSSLAKCPRDILLEREKCLSRMGERFEKGDSGFLPQ